MDKKIYTYDGKKLTEYEASQLQRKFERNIRKYKREIIAMNEAGFDIGSASAKLKKWELAHKNLLRRTGLKIDRSRLSANGFTRLKKPSKNGTINIEIDEFVPCVKDRKTGEIKSTVVSKISRKELKDYNIKNGWMINWSEVPKEFEIRALRIEGEDTIQGLVSFYVNKKKYFVEGHSAVSNPLNVPFKTENAKYSGV